MVTAPLLRKTFESPALNKIVQDSVDEALVPALASARTKIFAVLSQQFAELAKMSAETVSRNGTNGRRVTGGVDFTARNLELNGKRATAAVVAASAPKPKRRITPEQARRQKLHGAYVGLIAHSAGTVRTTAKEIFAKKGVRPAIAYLRSKSKAKAKAK